MTGRILSCRCDFLDFFLLATPTESRFHFQKKKKTETKKHLCYLHRSLFSLIIPECSNELKTCTQPQVALPPHSKWLVFVSGIGFIRFFLKRLGGRVPPPPPPPNELVGMYTLRHTIRKNKEQATAWFQNNLHWMKDNKVMRL